MESIGEEDPTKDGRDVGCGGGAGVRGSGGVERSRWMLRRQRRCRLRRRRRSSATRKRAGDRIGRGGAMPVEVEGEETRGGGARR
uniref:Uncharacterized protein n=1 Tax=Oryza rufipogon TaxID=4529 RepID=A0A0E0QML6_ORYRU